MCPGLCLGMGAKCLIYLKNRPLKGVIWCGREDSNFHGFNPTATSTLRVYHSATTALSWYATAFSASELVCEEQIPAAR